MFVKQKFFSKISNFSHVTNPGIEMCGNNIENGKENLSFICVYEPPEIVVFTNEI